MDAMKRWDHVIHVWRDRFADECRWEKEGMCDCESCQEWQRDVDNDRAMEVSRGN